MRALLPVSADPLDPVTAYAYPDAPATWLRANMISSLDGAASVEGRTGGLGVAADRSLFRLLRSLADAVLVGAGTVRVERYGPVRLRAEQRARRLAEGRPAEPAMAVVTSRADLDPAGPLFADPQARPILLTTAAAPADWRARLAEVADVVVAGADRVELPRAVAALHERGHRRLLTEGGPRLLAELVAAALLDELCLTVVARVLGGSAPRILDGPLVPDTGWTLTGLAEDAGTLFARYARR